MAKITKTVEGETVTYTEEATNLLDSLILGVLGPVKALSNDKNVFYSEDVFGIGCLASMAGGIAVERLTNVSEVVFPA